MDASSCVFSAVRSKKKTQHCCIVSSLIRCGSFDLSLKIAFTDDYTYNDFSMVFTVFTGDGQPYRSKGYKFNLKDKEGNWNVEQKEGCYTFVLPINKDLRIVDAGTYTFQIEYRMPITPLVGVKELTLLNNK